MGKVTVVPAKINKYTKVAVNENKKRKVAGYARVSTDADAQTNSYETQVNYYTSYIKSREDWQFVDVYTDEGITGTSTKKREGFKRMVADALAGKIDLILTKSISRFARNTVDTLTTIRQLKEKGVEIYFEKENIWTLDAKGEVVLTIMSSLAQEESRSISENVNWGNEKKYATGKFSMNYSWFLGYDKGEDGKLVVNKEGAKIVKRIYTLFLQGDTYTDIARKLTNDGIKTPAGKNKWGSNCIKSILTNEKYIGDALLRKYYTPDYLTKKQVRNKGEVGQFYVTGSHEAIIDKEIFDIVQLEVKNRSIKKKVGYDIFSGKIKCECCGGYFGAKVWHSNSKYRTIKYRCNNKYEKEKCYSKALSPDEIKEAFIQKINLYIKNHKSILEEFNNLNIFDTTSLEHEKVNLEKEVTELRELLEDLIMINSRKAQDQKKYNERYNKLAKEYDEKVENLENIKEKIASIKTREKQADKFIKDTQNLKPIIEFDKELWLKTVDYMLAGENGITKVRFTNGIEI